MAPAASFGLAWGAWRMGRTDWEEALTREKAPKMPDRAFVFTLIALLLMSSQFVYGQQTGERNLQICSTGKYPALCNHSELTRDQGNGCS